MPLMQKEIHFILKEFFKRYPFLNLILNQFYTFFYKRTYTMHALKCIYVHKRIRIYNVHYCFLFENNFLKN